jgi:aspartate/methionine/tyrosine aminotransferase
VSIDAERQVGACVGTKEFVASTAHYLRLRSPDRDTVLYPAVSYPTYAMGALLAGCRPVPVPELPGGGPDLSTVDKLDVDAGSGGVDQLTVESDRIPVPTWRAQPGGGDQGIPMFSDECYAEFTWDGPPRSVLEWGANGVVAVHSLSKRSNLAGVRAGFYAGDPELVAYLVDVRRHAGLMVPGPVQAGAAVALDDDAHVLDQRRRYLERLVFLAEVLGHAGLPVELPAGGFYLWVAVPTSASRGGWSVTEALALESGMLVSPGEFYGPLGAGFVRVAVVQPMDRLELVAERLAGRDLIAAL